MILVTKWFGVFLCDGTKIIDKRLMSKDAKHIAEKLAVLQSGSVLPEEKELSEGRVKLQVSDRRQAALGRPTLFDSSFLKAEDFGFSNELMRESMMLLGKLRTSEPISKDKGLVQAIRSLDDLIESSNLMNERLHEWYGLHFPELADHAKDRRYAELVSRYGERSVVMEHMDLDIESIGGDMDPGDMDAVMKLAGTLCVVYEEWDRTESYINSIVQDVCENVCALCGGPLAARLISLAGGLERLSSLPSSTVQMLGAEKAMFRHLRSGKKPPKHGIIFQHPMVHRAPYWQRGNIARTLASKISIAARIDQYGGEFRGDDLVKEMDERIADIQRRYPEPPKRKPDNNKKRRRPRK